MLWRVVGLVLVSWVAVGQAQHLVIGLDGVPHLMARMMNLGEDHQRQSRPGLPNQALGQLPPQPHALDARRRQLEDSK